jgi:hypothetical protein
MMSRKTLKINKDRLETIKRHVDWVKQQQPLVAALMQFTRGCSVYAPAPAAPATGEFDHDWTITHAHLLPDVCEQAVTIPANSVRLALLYDRGTVVVISTTDPSVRSKWRQYGTLSAALQIALPDGTIAKMRKTENTCVIQEEG